MTKRRKKTPKPYTDGMAIDDMCRALKRVKCPHQRVRVFAAVKVLLNIRLEEIQYLPGASK